MCSCCTSKSWQSADGINKSLTMLSNRGFLIYLNHCARIKTDYVQNGPEQCLIRLTCWVFEVGGPPEAPDQIAYNLVWPSSSDALGPNSASAVTLHGQCSIVGRYWTNPLTAFPLICSPSPSLTHDNLVSQPQGKDTQRKWFPLGLTNGSFSCVRVQVSSILCLPAGEILILCICLAHISDFDQEWIKTIQWVFGLLNANPGLSLRDTNKAYFPTSVFSSLNCELFSYIWY